MCAMKPNTSLRAALVAALAGLALAACDRSATTTSNASGNGATVGQKIEKAIDRTQEKLAAAGEKMKPALEKAGDKIAAATKEAASGDVAITTSINADYLKDPDLSVFKIDVDSKDGVVTLNGMAGNDAARTRAEKLAGAIKGVKEVRNHLTVKRG